MPGTLNLEKNPIVEACLRYAYDNNKLICAICAAPTILAHLGMLKGKKATCYPGFDVELKDCEYTYENVTIDGNIITGKGAGVVNDFALAIVERLLDKDRAMKIFYAMCCK